jgi:K+-sensing histidine kinase KdpD
MQDRRHDGRHRWPLRIGVALLAPVVAALALVPLRAHVLNTNLALVLVLVVLAAAVAGGRSAGVVGALSAALSYDFFLTVPYGSFTMERGDDIETTVLLALIGAIAGELVERARRNEAAAIARRRDLERLRRRAELAAGGERPGRLIERSAEELTELLDLKACRYVPTPPPEGLPIFTHDAIRVPGFVNDDAPRSAVALPVRAHGRDLGHFLLVFPTESFGLRASVDVKHAAVALADQLGMALLRYRRP